jgi:preprotein translocase subunit SecY
MNKILTRITCRAVVPRDPVADPADHDLGIKLQRLPLVGGWIDQYGPRWLLDGLGVNFYFGGTSLLIVVGVAMDTVNQIEAQLIMRHYEGFTPRAGRIRGRRSGM